MRFIKFFVFYLILFWFALASSLSAKQPPLLITYGIVILIGTSSDKAGKNLPVKYVDKLSSNSCSSCRTASIKNEREGTAELRDLANYAEAEDFWAFLPKKNLWIQIGFEESYAAVSLDQEFLKTIIDENDEINIYHIHLKHYLRLMEKQGYGNIPTSWLILPSIDDAAFMVYYSAWFYNQHPRGHIFWSILSPLGKTDYSLTSKGLDQYKAIRNDSFFLKFYKPDPGPSAGSRLPAASSFDIRSPHTAQDLISWANEQIDGYITIHFSPET